MYYYGLMPGRGCEEVSQEQQGGGMGRRRKSGGAGLGLTVTLVGFAVFGRELLIVAGVIGSVGGESC